MTEIDAWALRHHVSLVALAELAHVLRSYDVETDASDTPGSEARVTSLVRLEAANHGYWLTRNNVGAFQAPHSSRWVRYGLCNESKQQNAIIKSADLIGWRRRVIVSTDVGSSIAQFCSREVKREGWSFNPNDTHEVAQATWRDFVNSNGGDAAFVSGPGSFTHKPVVLPLTLPKR